jgi:C-terminal processing protease CtpA/Prc
MIDMIEPRTLENDVKRLERQLASVLQHETDQITASSISVSSAGASTLSSKHFAKRSKKKRVIVIVPPGKLGVVLANRHDGKGTVVSEVRHSSSLNGMLSPGDKLVAVDGEDVTGMVVSQITSLMSSSSQERRLTWITTAKSEPEYLDSQEEKVAESA